MKLPFLKALLALALFSCADACADARGGVPAHEERTGKKQQQPPKILKCEQGRGCAKKWVFENQNINNQTISYSCSDFKDYPNRRYLVDVAWRSWRWLTSTSDLFSQCETAEGFLTSNMSAAEACPVSCARAHTKRGEGRKEGREDRPSPLICKGKQMSTTENCESWSYLYYESSYSCKDFAINGKITEKAWMDGRKNVCELVGNLKSMIKASRACPMSCALEPMEAEAMRLAKIANDLVSQVQTNQTMGKKALDAAEKSALAANEFSKAYIDYLELA